MEKIIIFDFDYTLADSSEAPAECIRYAFKKLGLDVPSKERCQRTVGLSLSETFKELSPEDHSEKVESFCKYFLARADEVVVELTPLFDGVVDVLKALLIRGYKLGIASSKRYAPLIGILEKYNAVGLFSAIIGDDVVDNPKPYPDSIYKCLEDMGVPEDVLSQEIEIYYVGDSFKDAQLAQNANIPFIAVTSGTTTAEDFKRFKPYRIIDSVSKLLTLF